MRQQQLGFDAGRFDAFLFEETGGPFQDPLDGPAIGIGGGVMGGGRLSEWARL
ncbi:MAG: hypothetical protein ACK6D4_01300 [Planctomyces sp.]